MARILVVDDDPAVCELMIQILKPLSHEVVTTVDPREALAKIGRRPFDLVILDLSMSSMDGFEFLEHLRAAPDRADTPVLVVTGRNKTSTALREAELGAIGHISKPFLAQEIEDVVADALKGHGRSTHRNIVLEADVFHATAELMRGARETAAP